MALICKPWQKAETDTATQTEVCRTSLPSVFGLPHALMGMKCDGLSWSCLYVDGAVWLGVGMLVLYLGQKKSR